MFPRIYLSVFVYIFILCSPVFASKFYFMDIKGNKSIETKYLEVASRYYGIDIVRCSENNECLDGIGKSIEKKTIDGILVTASSLAYINHNVFFEILDKYEKKIPLMIFGISPGNEADIGIWSGGSIKNVVSISGLADKSFYLFSINNAITRQLAGVSLNNKNELASYFVLNSGDNQKSIMDLYFAEDNRKFPVFINKMYHGGEIFFLSKIVREDLNSNIENVISKDRFYEIAPFMMFLRYACGDSCWHSSNYFANLTIDDPWLREPYGNLSYYGLLQEMKKENFHTTIAFVPWNYDRSDPGVASLIRDNSNYFSIVIHGNDHNHKEFYQLSKQNEKEQSKQLQGYERKVEQSLARMEKFKELTKIPYDRIMVFPHNIAPQYTFSLLKKYGFLATINSRNVPSGSQEPGDPTFRLRCITTSYEGFPSIRRNGDEYIATEDLAIELFLGNPILIFRHQGDFADNTASFNKIAQFINTLQPDVKWGSLGYIVRNYYLERQKDDGNVDVLMYANDLIVTNNSNVTKKYFIKKMELPSYSKLLHVLIDGIPVSYGYKNDHVTFEVMVPGKKSVEITIKYNNEIALVKTDLGKDNYYYAALRYISDFRDIFLSRNRYGRIIIGNYYNPTAYKVLIVISIGLLGVLILGITYIYKRKKNIHRNI